MTNSIVPSDRALIHGLADEWHNYLTARVEAGEYAPETAVTYRAGLNAFLEWAEQSAVYTPDLALRWKAFMVAGKLSANTISVRISGARAFFAWALLTGQIQSNPFAGLRGAKRKGTTQHHLRDPLTNEEVRRLLAAADTSKPEGTRDKAIICLMLYCGLRQVEIQRAEFKHIRTEGERLVMDVWGKGRTEADETVIIAHQDAITAVYDWMGKHPTKTGALFVSLSNRSYGERLSTRAVRFIVKSDLMRKVGIVNARKTTHSLRHTAITKAVQKSGKIQKAQSMARHSSITTTMIYAHELDRYEDPAEDYIQYED